MELFETAFFSDKKYRERVYDTELDKSIVRDLDNQRTEYYIQDPDGEFVGFLDPSVHYSIKYGNYRDSLGQAGKCSPIYRVIRDNYVRDGKFNMNPHIWYLDIETRSGERYITSPDTKIQIIENGEAKLVTVAEAQEMGYDGKYALPGSTNFEPISSAPFMRKTQAFPEPKLAEHEITLIQILDNKTNTIYILGRKDVKIDELRELGYLKDVPQNVRYVACKEELQLLMTFGALFQKLNPLIILAWNGEGFDFPYLYNRMAKFGIENMLSVYGTPEPWSLQDDKTKVALQSPGHMFMDFMEVYKKFTFTPQPSYALDAIAEYELKKNKVRHDEYATFDSFYTGESYIVSEQQYEDVLREKIRLSYINKSEDFNHFVDLQFVLYGIYDVVLLKGIDDKLKLIPLMSKVASIMGVLLSDTLRTVKPWSQYISNEAHFRGQVMPPYQENERPRTIGGYVKQPVPGMYSWVMNADINSMYPRLCISAFNMSPETFIPLSEAPAELRDAVLIATKGDQNEETVLNLDANYQEHIKKILKKYNVSMGVNGALFTHDKHGIVPELVSKIFFQRKEMKKRMLTCYNIVTEIDKILESRND